MNNWRFFRWKRYWKYRFKAKKGVRAHSPFIYKMSLQLFDPFPKKLSWIHLEKRRAHCLNRNIKCNGRFLSNIVDYFTMKRIVLITQENSVYVSYIAASDCKPNVIIHENETERELLAPFDLLFISKKKQEDCVMQYFKTAIKYADNKSVFIVEEPHRSPKMEAYWDTMKNESPATVTLDLFKMGVVFFRKESSKENFIIRF
jgi:hypothetical protein